MALWLPQGALQKASQKHRTAAYLVCASQSLPSTQAIHGDGELNAPKAGQMPRKPAKKRPKILKPGRNRNFYSTRQPKISAATSWAAKSGIHQRFPNANAEKHSIRTHAILFFPTFVVR